MSDGHERGRASRGSTPGRAPRMPRRSSIARECATDQGLIGPAAGAASASGASACWT